MTHGQKNLGSSLTENLKRVWTLVNDLCSNKWTSFSPSDLKILTDFFHLPSGGLDWQKLYQVLSDRMFYSQFTTQIQSLMQLSDTHGQFMNLTGQEALNRIAQWDNFVVENMVRWNERIKLYNKIPGFGPQIHPGIQAMYIDDGSDLAQRKARKVSLAYLSLLRLDDKALRVKLLDAFQSHAEINEQKIFSQGDAQDPKNFGPLIDQLEENSAFIAKGLQSLDQFFNTLDNEKAGYYQLRMGEHILAIAKRQGEDEKIHWYVYDANFGEISMTSDKFQNTSDPLRLMLQDYFTHLKNVRQENGTGVFDVYQFNSDHMFKTSSFKQLKEFISNTDGLLHTLSTHKFFKTHKNRGNTQQVGKLSRTVDMLGKAHQGLSWIRSLTFLSHYWRRRYSDQLMESQKQALDFEAQLAMAGLMYDVGSTFLELGFSKLGFQLIQKFSSQSVGVFASRIQRLQFKAGLKLARYGGPFLNILGAGFDIYQAQKTATELKTATEPDIQQDLKVSIALSSLGAFISLTSGLTFLALSGKMALMGGMMGIALGMLTAVVGGIYFSVREVQQIERYATLTGSQKLRTGWLKFLGSEIDTEVANQVTKGQAEKQAKENIHQQFKTHFQALLDSDNEIEAVYYTTGPIILSGCPYKKLTGRKRADLALTVSKLNRNIFTKYIKDKILPSQAGAILLDHRRKKEGQFSLYVDLTLENSEYKFYDFEGLSATHDKISLDTDVLSEGILSVKRQSQLSSTSSPSVPPIKADPPDSTKPAKIYFFLGAGNDEVVGYKEKRNIFDIGDGTKNFKGGGQSDTFIFRGNTPPPKPSVLDGVRGSNLLIANKKPSQGGYRVDLQAGYFSFTEGDDSKKIATLKNIHHIETCPETDDVIWGNDQTNILNGKGGEDKLIGFDGNDILVAQAGKMEGGKGTDCYRVLQNTHGEPATLIIKEEDDPEEFSHVFLDYSVEQIISIRRLKQNVLIELRNNNDSITTLTLSYLYFLSVERPQRRLTTQYIFYTQEGVIFSGLPSEIAFNFNEEEPEPLTLIAQYAQKFDQKFTPPEYESEKYPLIIQKMAYQKNRGGYRYQGRKKNIAGFFEISSARNGF
ncbi:calcium-binding protein [Candidatus Williamhamiltonella defendens]|uniref:calcium-binding protein n=1 Tax=Candidatus Williamhamiltonella defendens TaxID=138072 RepID=UPI001F42074F|nr:calcium-binding protein [Candidatus Hamiltonella defensa]